MSIFAEVLEVLLRFLLPILIIILVLTLINIINNYRKYGTRIFSSFKKYDLNSNMKYLVIDMLRNESHNDIFIIDRSANSFYAITNYEIFSILIFDYGYSLSGNIQDKYLKGNGKQILNPIPQFLNDNNKVLENKINFKTIYINTKKDVKINIDGLTDIYTLKDFSYKLYQNQHSDIKYSKEEMTQLKKRIEDIINGNN